MSIEIISTLWGFQVRIQTTDREALRSVVERLKAAIPKRTRRYYEANRYWFIEKRSERRLRQWIDTVQHTVANVRVMEKDQKEIAA